MNSADQDTVNLATQAAIEVLLYNAQGPVQHLPRTAAFGYPEPYTRDLLISLFGIVAIEHASLLQSLRHTMEKLADNQSEFGQIPSLVHDKYNQGSSDTTPLFLIAAGVFRSILGDSLFLEDAVNRSIQWMEYQCPTYENLIAQQPTSDWRDEQWVSGYGLYVNTLTYIALKLLGKGNEANKLGVSIGHFTYSSTKLDHPNRSGLVIEGKPHYALWSYKVYSSERFDLLGNSLAILSGLASPSKARAILEWVEIECEVMRSRRELAVGLAPNFFPFITPEAPDWMDRYSIYNRPGDYHNGGIWPFVTGFHIAALVAAGEQELAEKHLLELTRLVKLASNTALEFGFNEWYKAQDGQPMGQDWQTWSASNYLYAAKCVRDGRTPIFDQIRE